MIGWYKPSSTTSTSTIAPIWYDNSTTATVTPTGSNDTTGFWICDGTHTGVPDVPPNTWIVFPQPAPVPPAPAPVSPPAVPSPSNPYLLTSDVLEGFIRDLAGLGVRQRDVLAIPLELFINWLIVKAAELDDIEVPDIAKLPEPDTLVPTNRCRWCGQFISEQRRQAGILFCSGGHLDRYTQRAEAEL